MSAPTAAAEAAPTWTARFGLRAQSLAVVLLLVVYVLLGWRGRLPLGIGSNDELAYLALSHSLEAGTYRELFQPSAPLHVQYPPGYPAWLVLVRHATGERVALIPAVNLALAAAALVLLVNVASEVVDGWQGSGGWWPVAMLLVLVLNPGLLMAGGSSASEALFLLLSTGSLAAASRADRGDDSWAFAAIGLALLAFLTRAAGVALVAAIGVWLVFRGRRWELVIYGMASVVVVGGWFAYTALAPHSPLVSTYANDFMSGRASERPSAVAPFVRRAWNNAVAYGSRTLPSELALPTIPNTRVDNVAWLLVNAACVSTALVLLWRTWRALAAYLVLYAAMVVIWAWPVNRFLWPVVPFAMLAILYGGWRLAHRLPPRAASLAFGGLVLLLAVGAALAADEHIERTRDCDRRAPYTSPGCYAPEIRGMARAAEYLRQHAATGDAVLAWRASAVAFLSGHLAESAVLVNQFPRGAVPRALRERRIGHVLLTSNSEFERGTLTLALLDSCTELRVEARFPVRTLLLRLVADGEPTADACADLREFQRDSRRMYESGP